MSNGMPAGAVEAQWVTTSFELPGCRIARNLAYGTAVAIEPIRQT